MSRHATTVWARSFVDELARHGVAEIVLAPGSRSTPLVLACAQDERFRVRVHLDERSAAFFALGVGKASGRSAAVVTTSGTATANVLPAVVEACQGETPLLVLTADRPHHLRDSDANQAIDQVGLYGGFARASFDMALPELSEAALRHLRVVAGRAVAAAQGPPAGPVHVNLPFDKPLEPDGPVTLNTSAEETRGHFGEVEGAAVASGEMSATALKGRADGTPHVQITRTRRMPDEASVESIRSLLDADRGVIVAGPSPEPGRVGTAVLELALSTGFPVLADPLSGARYGPAGGAHRVSAYDLFLSDSSVAALLKPSVIVRVGASPTSAAVLGWLRQHDGVHHVVVDGGGRWKDHGATATHYVSADPADTLHAVAASTKRVVSGPWSAAWLAAERAALEALADDDGPPHEGSAVSAVAAAAPPGSTLFVSSSMPVRDLDAFAHPRDGDLEVLGNRGASGIDGIVSTAFGVASQRAEPTLCVLGDIAFFHDQNGLLWARESDARVVFILIDNDGGGIFHMLPIAEHEPHFTEYFATPHGLDLRHATDMHGIELRDASIPELGEAIESALGAMATTVVRVRTDRSENQERRRQLREAVTRAALAALTAEA